MVPDPDKVAGRLCEEFAHAVGGVEHDEGTGRWYVEYTMYDDECVVRGEADTPELAEYRFRIMLHAKAMYDVAMAHARKTELPSLSYDDEGTARELLSDLLDAILDEMPAASNRDMAADGPVGTEEEVVWERIRQLAEGLKGLQE